MRALLPDFLFSGGRVHAGAALIVRDGIVLGIGEPPEEAEVTPMRGRALLLGLTVAASHAFQRAIRGRTEHRSHATDDFWSWREAMYAAAERLTPDDLHAISKFCFLEMARAGITAVGEFHYLHRDASGKPYADPNELDLAVASAAREAGLRIVLLRVAYARSGFRVPENPRQKRFIEGSAEEYLRNLGDGVVRADLLLAAGVRLCIGSDSEVQLSPLEDARQLEYHLRLMQEQRAILDLEPAGVGGLGARLYGVASEGGMRSLGLPGGSLRPGDPADFIAVDLDDPSIAGANAEDLMANVLFA